MVTTRATRIVDKMGDRLNGCSQPALLSTGEGSAQALGEYRMRLRSTERIRLIVQSHSLRVGAPQQLVVRIRRSLSVVEQSIRPSFE